MNSIVEVLILFLTGCLGGYIAGMLGVGGGAIYVIIFSEYFENKGIASDSGDVFVKMLIANTIFSVFFAGLSGTLKQIRIRNFFPNEILQTALPATLSALAITVSLYFSDWYSKEKFSIFFVLVLLPLIVKTAITKEQTIVAEQKKNNPWWIRLTGFGSGFVTSLTGLGGGYFVIPMLSGILNFPIKKSMSISLGSMTIVSFALSCFYFIAYSTIDSGLPLTFGAISIFITLPVITGVLISAPFGVAAAQKLSPKILRICWLIFFLLIISRMIWKMF